MIVLERIELKLLNKIRLKLIKLLLSKRDISTIVISLGFAEEEYVKRYNNPEHVGYKSEGLRNSLKDIDRLQIDFEYMLNINHRVINEDYKSIIHS
jgi:hypothetical protein